MEPGMQQQRPKKRRSPSTAAVPSEFWLSIHLSNILNKLFSQGQTEVPREVCITLTEDQHVTKVPCSLLLTLCFSLIQQIFIVEASVRNPDS